MTNFQADLLDYFVPDEDFVYYEDESDMIKKQIIIWNMTRSVNRLPKMVIGKLLKTTATKNV